MAVKYPCMTFFAVNKTQPWVSIVLVYWIFFLLLFFYQFYGSFANNRHIYKFLAKIVLTIKRILPLTALQLTGCFNVKWMVNGSVFKLFLQ
jgi:hypothetical protein